jgi:phosphate transport system substrate-binding protein
MFRQCFATVAMILFSTARFYGQNLEALPHYQPGQMVAGTIRVWGHGSFRRDFMGRLMKYWEEGFRKYQPQIQIENRMYGTASAIGALYTGAGDLAILGEEIRPAAAAAFERVLHYPPEGVEIATGSLDVRNFDYAHVFFVHEDNPISKLTLTQLDGIFGDEHRRGPRNIRTWGELGLAGEWKDKPIHPYGWRLDDDFALYLQEALLMGSHKWNCDLRAFAHITNPDGTVYDHGKRILDALARDPLGIAVSNLRYMSPRVKPLALAARDGEPYYEATKENLVERKYPLTRIIPAFFNRAPGQPLDPKVKEFLRYLLSFEGQQDILRDANYLPLSQNAIREQLKKLD